MHKIPYYHWHQLLERFQKHKILAEKDKLQLLLIDNEFLDKIKFEDNE
eukprot:CAMPEP_0116917534 /NCGR_PEP_ID=MMETSP0467-20121206/19205_1 /TAXON_ID=283647 /ORGANISM="Mesodinium pulex, Strain SPMC105" /LENGTH=47 /DNA_ID= /DNA_START= /DNA_END= /DNA_ORIENTATION=